MERLSDYLNDRIKFIKFTNSHKLQDKKEWIKLRDEIDFQNIDIKANDLQTAIKTIEKLIMLGYNCIAYDVLQANLSLFERCFKFGNVRLSQPCYNHMLGEYRNDMNIKLMYDYFNKKR